MLMIFIAMIMIFTNNLLSECGLSLIFQYGKLEPMQKWESYVVVYRPQGGSRHFEEGVEYYL